MRILIVGSGIAGLSLAGFLRQQGIEPILIEQTKKWSEVGYGIYLWNNGIKILEKLGLEKHFFEKGKPIWQWELRDANGKMLSQLELDPKKIAPFTVIHHAQLHEVLRQKVPQSWISMDTTVTEINQTPDFIEAKLSNGKTERCDLLVGADGIHSKVRELSFQSWELKDYGTLNWSFWIPPEIEMPKRATEIWGNNGKDFLLMPMKTRNMAYMAMPSDRLADTSRDLDFLKSQFNELGWFVPEILDSLNNPEEIFCDRNYQVKAERWIEGKTVLIGDAAHALHPIVGMGASLAMEDAYVLAQEIQNHGKEGLSTALENYSRRRKPRVGRFAREASLWKIGILSRSNFLAKIRNFIIKHTSGFETLFLKEAEEISENLFDKL